MFLETLAEIVEQPTAHGAKHVALIDALRTVDLVKFKIQHSVTQGDHNE